MGFENIKYSSEQNTMTRKYIVPVRVVLSEKTDFAQGLLCDSPRQPAFAKDDYTLIHKSGFVLVDFGSEIQGGAEITVQTVSQTPAHMRLVFGESVMESLSTVGGERNPTNDHSVRDMIVEAVPMMTMRHGNTGFRFLKIEAVDCDILIRGIKGVLEYKDIDYKGSFECSDSVLNQVWNAGAYTVHLCMNEYIWDGIKRDRLVWIGDMHPEVSTIMSVFGYDSSVEKSLDHVKSETPANQWMNTLPSYTLWWIKIQRDWYFQNGDIEYLNQQKDYLYEVMPHVFGLVNDDGTTNAENHFVDWSSKNTEYEECGFHGCLMIALQGAAEIFEVFGDSSMSEKCDAAYETLLKYVPAYSGNKQVTAIAALAGLIDLQKANDEILSKELLEGLSTFYGYYVLTALGEAENMEGAIDILRGYWGKMLELGATTFWEDFDIAWTKNCARIDEVVPDGKDDIHGDFGKFCYQKFRHSLCHGWASGPVPFMMRYILGIKVLEPGCKKIAVKPQLGSLRYAKGTYPTPYGLIKVEHKMENGKIVSKIETPEEIVIAN